jgi:hypothetical protein
MRRMLELMVKYYPKMTIFIAFMFGVTIGACITAVFFFSRWPK